MSQRSSLRAAQSGAKPKQNTRHPFLQGVPIDRNRLFRIWQVYILFSLTALLYRYGMIDLTIPLDRRDLIGFPAPVFEALALLLLAAICLPAF